MPNPPSFFVHVIESPSSQDLLDGRTEGRMLIEALGLSEVPSWYNLVTDRATLRDSLNTRLNEAVTQHNLFPIIHLSVHGNNNGIGLTNHDTLTWQDLRDMLLPINTMTGGGLIVCLSSCYGASGIRMAMYPNQPLPFHALLGHTESITWADSAIAFVTLYHHLRKGSLFPDAVHAMKTASGNSRFQIELGVNIQQSYVEFLKGQELSRLQTSLTSQSSK